MAAVKPLAALITAHCFNKDRTQIVVCPGTAEALIYDCSNPDAANWKVIHTLTEHTGMITDIDWCPVNNHIVTCSQDRNAYVWRLGKDGKWMPALCVLHINRAATSVRWSPDGNKFAVTSGSKLVPVAYYEGGADWYISKAIKKHRSTVLTLAWCPNSKFIVTGSTDFKCRILSAYIDKLDPKEDDGFGALWPTQHKFGECLVEFDQAKAWVNAVAWSPSGMTLAFAGHGSTAHFVSLAADNTTVATVQHQGLPFSSVEFLADNTVVMAGYDQNPTVFANTGTGWEAKDVVDKEVKAEAKAVSAVSSARNMFQQAASQGVQFGAQKKDATKNTIHKNAITDIRLPYSADTSENVYTFSTSGVDGRVVQWDLKKSASDRLKDWGL